MAEVPKSWAEMSAEAMREGAVLVLVFGLLDKYMFDHGPSGPWTAMVVAISAVSFVVGCVLERTARQ